jgi:AraC-like DNA-binding protein
MTDAALVEIIARMSAAMLCLLTSAVLLLNARRSLAARLGALFGLGAAAYMICASQTMQDLVGAWLHIIEPLGWLDGVFFWWFCLALFCDQYRFRAAHLLPAIPILILVPLQYAVSDPFWRDAMTLIKQSISVVLFLHATYFALLSLKDDLVDTRRRFRVVIAVSVGLSAVILMGLEIVLRGTAAETAYLVGSALWLLALSFAFALWALRASPEMFVDRKEVRQHHDSEAAIAAIDPADRPLLARLEAAMQAGAYRETGLTVGKLADQLKTPEHRLRKLINSGLGYRNFSSYINSHRVEDAKEILADPERARLQILQVALDLGYGSIASFNRAFREATGEAPTSFRRKALMAD